MQRWYRLLLGLVTLMSLLVVAIPMFLIRPFVAQTAHGLALSYQLRSISPITTLVLCGIGVWITLKLWGASNSGLQRLPGAAASVLLLASVIMARQNHFEWIFHPMPKPGYVGISK